MARYIKKKDLTEDHSSKPRPHNKMPRNGVLSETKRPYESIPAVQKPETIQAKLRALIDKRDMPKLLFDILLAEETRPADKLKAADLIMKYSGIHVEKVAQTDANGDDIAQTNINELTDLWKEKIKNEVVEELMGDEPINEDDDIWN